MSTDKGGDDRARSPARYDFQYEPLPQSDGPCVRLLELEPETVTGLRIQLKHVKLGQHDDFEALSYCWGEDSTKLPIWCNQRKFQIPRRLWIALNRLRNTHSGQSRLLWADAICINQEDVKERNSQVLLMRQIFEAAKLVIAWLGEEANGSHQAMQMVKNVGEGIWQHLNDNLSIEESIKRYQELVLARLPYVGVGHATWTAYWELLRRSYYSRVWIIQEIVVAKEVLVVCGADEVLWRNFYYVARFLYSSGLVARFPNQMSYLEQINIVGNARENAQRNHRLPFIEMLFNYQYFQATDNRDKVFALYGLLHSDCCAGAVEPDYNLKLEDVFMKTTIAILETECNLNILSGPLKEFTKNTSIEIPSWVADWSTLDKFAPKPLIYPQSQASAGSPYIPRFLEGQRIMQVSGFIFDTIVCVGMPVDQQPHSTGPWAWLPVIRKQCHFHRLYLDWERVAQARSKRIYFNGEDMLDVYWQTLLGGFTSFADQILTLDNPEKDGKIISKTLFQRFDRQTRLNLALHKWLYWLPGVDYLCGSITVAALFGRLLFDGISFIFGRRVTTPPTPSFELYTTPAIERRIFRTERGYVGLGPRSAVVGDKIAILKGGRVAYALRPNSTRWRLLGDAYLHGIMRGEAFEEEKCEPMLLE